MSDQSNQAFFTAVLQGIGAPVSAENLRALAGVAHLEGANDRYNPLNSVVPSGNSTSFNSVHVQDYKSFENGVKGTIALLNGNRWKSVVGALRDGSSAQAVAQQFANIYQGWDPGVTASSFLGGGTGALSQPSGRGGSVGDAVPSLSVSQRDQAIRSGAGDLYSLALAIPELHQLLNKAINTGQTASDFQNAVENTQWYRQHSDSVRQAIVLKQSDPSTYQKNLQQATAHITSVAQQLGVTPGTELNGIATRFMSEGWNDSQLLQFFQKAHVAWNFNGGAAGQAISQMRQIASDYGVPVTEQAYNQWAKNVATGADNIDSFRQRMIHNASSIYPGLATQLTGGQTTKQLADPYIAKMAETLELNPETIKWGSDPHIKRALQTPVTSPAGAGAKMAAGEAQPPGTTPLWQFEQQLRGDPRWQYTDNAKSSTASLLTQLGKDWGMAA